MAVPIHNRIYLTEARNSKNRGSKKEVLGITQSAKLYALIVTRIFGSGRL
jgi:hypothetical protein